MAYTPIRDYGVIGDRRTAALVGRDGSVDWLCLPDFDGPSVFGALLDDERGGRFRVGPAGGEPGRIAYLGNTNILQTRFPTLVVTDAMVSPGPRALADANSRVLVRRLEAVGGQARCELLVEPVYDYGRQPATAASVAGGAVFRGPGPTLSLAAPFALEDQTQRVRAAFTLQPGEVRWLVLAAGDSAGGPEDWPSRRAEDALAFTERYWRDWAADVTYRGPYRERMVRSALLVHLLSYAPRGSLVAAPTTSLPEIVGGPKNWDYRYAWVRDASLAIASLALLGPIDDARAYMDWLLTVPPDEDTGAPLKVMYGLRGETDLTERTLDHLDGYMGSRPVRVGNRAHGQFQLDAFGIFVDCAEIYLRQGGHWEVAYWDLVARVADFVADNWQRPGHDIWELGVQAHWVNSKMLCWVALERAVRIARRLREDEKTDRWLRVMGEIHREVLARGWSERQRAFVQRYGSESLDAAVLLGPVLHFLPAKDPRVLTTARRLQERLGENGMLLRFRPEETPAGGPPGEGAFNPCTLWLITTLARAGLTDEAEQLAGKMAAVAAPLGLMPEEADPGEMVGNVPLLFSQIEWVRVGLELERARQKRGLSARASTLALRGGEALRKAHDDLKQWLRANRSGSE